MKKRILSIFVLLIGGTIMSSCNSCENKDNDPLPVRPPDVTTNAKIEIDATTTSEEYSARDDRQLVNSEVKSSTEPITGKSSKKPARKTEPVVNYSAPNGTDAENHDGDPYTKNDTTPMPTGTSIR